MVKRQPESAKGRAYWKIEGYDSSRLIYCRELSSGYIGENRLKPMLQALAAKAGLEFDEIVGAFASRRSSCNDLLEFTRDGPHLRFSCGTNPYFTAVFVRAG